MNHPLIKVKKQTHMKILPCAWHPYINIPSHLIGDRLDNTHSSVLAWRIPGMVEPGGLPSMGSHRVRHDWGDLAAASVGSSDKKIHLQCRSSSDEESTCNAGPTGDTGSIPGSGRYPGGSRKLQPTLVFLPGEAHGQWILAGYSPQGHKESDMTEATEHARW